MAAIAVGALLALGGLVTAAEMEGTEANDRIEAGDAPDTGGGPGGGGPAGPSILAGAGAASTGYATPVMVTQRGGPLSFVNLDVVQHDVVAKDKGPDGGPLFKTKLIGLAESAPVEGLEKTQPGRSYGFYCSLHPGMQGTLSVGG